MEKNNQQPTKIKPTDNWPKINTNLTATNKSSVIPAAYVWYWHTPCLLTKLTRRVASFFDNLGSKSSKENRSGR